MPFIRKADQPVPGFYLTRLVRGGPLVPVRICHDDRGWWAEEMGRVVGDPDPDPVRAEKVLSFWHYSQPEPITEQEYRKRIKALKRPGAPPVREKIDLNKIPPLF